ncbi:cytochrome c oxidase assembly protein COX19-like isoform X3 [Macadamia integrifolia]|uniref:cytochrome c oxidase assembly protein COX19-like isoform X3 n=1 Tax=Macadamia integrifolia TaxID=60698 RepID=UPI001C4FF96C|nr:cytochrome c oxidase assembly protein COX19-like isoform X3 [Macadamia integrifolia]
MSAGGAFGGNRGLRPVPPEKGIFPLDHMHECDLEKKAYVTCLKSSGYQSERCRQFSKKYLECRMERDVVFKFKFSAGEFSALGSGWSGIQSKHKS